MRVGINDRDGIQQALDQGADGILVPYINTAQEAREAVSAALYPTGAPPFTQSPACLPPRRPVGTELVRAGCSGHALGVLPAAFDEQEGSARSVALSPSLLSPARLFPPLLEAPSRAASALWLGGEGCGLTRRLSVRLGYAGASNKNVIIALQVETADCIRNMEEIAAIPGVDMLFLGQNDLCMSMGLYEKYEFPHMYTSPELNAATTKLIYNARKNNKILGLFLFGTDRVAEFMDKGFTFISVVRPRLWLRFWLCCHSIC